MGFLFEGELQGFCSGVRSSASTQPPQLFEKDLSTLYLLASCIYPSCELSAQYLMSRALLRSIVSPSTIRKFSSTMSNTYIKRTTLFKIPPEHIDKVLKEYETLRKNAVKVCFPSVLRTFLPFVLSDCLNQDGKPYIVSNVARRITNTDSPLSEGFTISSQSIFKNKEDHEFYDKGCPAHKELKVRFVKVPRDSPRCRADRSIENHWPSSYRDHDSTMMICSGSRLSRC